ncbi:MAG TPA: hypothetical protein VK806_05290, partial [Bacteroidia bacterium]|nr:hypothetical protein [Bacteroidia bacterium]
GIWNCDHPCPLPTTATLAATFMCNNDTITGTEVYLVEKERNMIFRYSIGRSFSFNPKATNFAWCVTRDNKIAIFTAKDFNCIPVLHGLYTFNMKMIHKEIASDEDVRNIFKCYL